MKWTERQRNKNLLFIFFINSFFLSSVPAHTSIIQKMFDDHIPRTLLWSGRLVLFLCCVIWMLLLLVAVVVAVVFFCCCCWQVGYWWALGLPLLSHSHLSCLSRFLFDPQLERIVRKWENSQKKIYPAREQDYLQIRSQELHSIQCGRWVVRWRYCGITWHDKFFLGGGGTHSWCAVWEQTWGSMTVNASTQHACYHFFFLFIMVFRLFVF